MYIQVAGTKEQVVANSTYVTDDFVRIHRERFNALYTAVSEKFTEITTTKKAKQMQKFALDVKAEVLSIATYAKHQALVMCYGDILQAMEEESYVSADDDQDDGMKHKN